MVNESTTSLSSTKKADGGTERDENHERGIAKKQEEVKLKYQLNPSLIFQKVLMIFFLGIVL